ncbi:hypothetical protein BGZ61DRAFT_538054 [Ilyonectria robusta]|uniref:uncharacterized protein n=1 Tax=Ilyonectria robusta TaxID=1079257 RepID=UPI001E8EE594|nr:uncharacterized protein BGZ61DRAFT_538054 [Ilyonectria robusta]KAH8667884.1 hypothetical protein BGZ61DRAFT_538054 [Ilyonectria robusta]
MAPGYENNRDGLYPDRYVPEYREGSRNHREEVRDTREGMAPTQDGGAQRRRRRNRQRRLRRNRRRNRNRNRGVPVPSPVPSRVPSRVPSPDLRITEIDGQLFVTIPGPSGDDRHPLFGPMGRIIRGTSNVAHEAEMDRVQTASGNMRVNSLLWTSSLDVPMRASPMLRDLAIHFGWPAWPGQDEERDEGHLRTWIEEQDIAAAVVVLEMGDLAACLGLLAFGFLSDADHGVTDPAEDV